MTLLIVYFLIALLFSFLCSLMESVILSVTRSFVAKKKQQERDYATHLEDMKKNIDRPLAAILTLNTFAHTLGAAGVGAQAQLLWGEEILTVVSIILTILILVFSEIIPKTIGANYWMQLTQFTVIVLRIIMAVLYPFVWLSQKITRLFNIDKRKSVLSKSDFSALAHIAEEEGIFARNESEIIKNVAMFDQIKAKDIMTPRTMMFAVDERDKLGDFQKQNPDLVFSRIPLYNESKDEVGGFILKDELLLRIIEGDGDKPLKSIMRPIINVFQNLSISQLYAKLTKENAHIALVVDEYGGTAGLVTLEDVIETILGLEIVDETDNIEDLAKAARTKWEERARKMGLTIE